jgi:hypothetical protein
MRDDLNELTKDELQNHIRLFLIRDNKNALLKVKNNRNLSFEKKSFYLRKIKENIKRLERGNLVPYEDFSAI